MARFIVAILLGLACVIPIDFSSADTLPVQCQCVKALRVLEGVDIHGDAKYQKPNIPIEAVKEGDVLLMKYGNISHVALITKVDAGMLQINEYNFRHCKETVRVLSYKDEHITGVFRPGAEGELSTGLQLA